MCAAAQGSLRDAEFAKAVCNRLRFYSSSMGGKKRKSFSLSDNLLSSSAVKKLLLFLFELSLSLSIFLRSRFVFPSLSCPSGGNFLLSTRNSTQRRRCRIPVSRRLETTGQKHDKQKKNKIYIFYKGRRNSNSGTVKKKERRQRRYAIIHGKSHWKSNSIFFPSPKITSVFFFSTDRKGQQDRCRVVQCTLEARHSYNLYYQGRQPDKLDIDWHFRVQNCHSGRHPASRENYAFLKLPCGVTQHSNSNLVGKFEKKRKEMIESDHVIQLSKESKASFVGRP